MLLQELCKLQKVLTKSNESLTLPAARGKDPYATRLFNKPLHDLTSLGVLMARDCETQSDQLKSLQRQYFIQWLKHRDEEQEFIISMKHNRQSGTLVH